jgi:hypothetical protein
MGLSRSKATQCVWAVVALGTVSAAAAEPPPPPPPHHWTLMALHTDAATTPAKPNRDGTPPVHPDVACHHLLVCAKLQAEALIERLDATAPGAFLRLSSGVGLGYRF